MALHHIEGPERSNFLRSNVLDVHRAFSMTLEQMAEFVEVAEGLSPNRRRPLEAKLRFRAYRGLPREYAGDTFGRPRENALRAMSEYVLACEANGCCRVEKRIKGLADSQIWENSFPFRIPDMVSVSSWDNGPCVEAAKADDGQV
jgi:hypothetical protein